MPDLNNREVRITRPDGSEYLIAGSDKGTPKPKLVVSSASMWAMADVRPGDEDGLSGESGGLDTEGGRALAVQVTFSEYDETTIQLTQEEIDAFLAVGAEELLLEWCIGGAQRAYYVRPRGVDYSENLDEHAFLTLRFRAIDPRKYGEEETFDVDATPADVEYGGNRPTAAYLLTVEGPVTNPRFVATLDDLEDFVVQGFGSVPSGSTLELDGRTQDMRVVDADGIPSYDMAFQHDGGGPAVLWPLPLGEATVQFTSTAGTDDAVLHVRPAV